MTMFGWTKVRPYERGLVFRDGELVRVLAPGDRFVASAWNPLVRVRIDRRSVRALWLEHRDAAVIAEAPGALEYLETVQVSAGSVGLLYRDGRLAGTLEPGVHAFWRGEETLRVAHLDLREQVLDVHGQEIMTADKVTLRLNALAVYRVVDAEKAVSEVEDHAQALYRQAQLALRALVGTRELDALLADKDGVARELEETLRARAAGFGVEVKAAGIRDVILPGEMKEILNRVTEARKAAEAALVTRREETAAMRSQANTAKIFESNPTLMKLRELEVLERVAEKANLSVVLGEGGLAERVVKLL